jgi:hypothetical protein
MNSRNFIQNLSVLCMTLLLSSLFSCQRGRVAVDKQTAPRPVWDSGLSIRMNLDDAEVGDSVLVSATATATNRLKETRELCVNLHFVANFRDTKEGERPEESPDYGPEDWRDSEGVQEIASSPWRKNGKQNCISRTLKHGESFQESFSFKYSKADFVGARGDILVTCQIWFQTRADIPDRSLTCDMDHYAHGDLPVRTR